MPLHPVVVHFPVALAILVPLVGAAVLLAWWRGWLPSKTWALVVGLQAALAVSAVVAMNTGERDEDRVEKVVAEASIEAHEDAGKLFTIAGFGVLALAAAPLLLKRESLKQALAGATLVGTLAVAGLGYNVGHKGGRLVYAEGAGAAYAPSAKAPAQAARSGNDHHDD